MSILNFRNIQKQILSSNKEKARQLVSITGQCWPFFCSFWDTVSFRVVRAICKPGQCFQLAQYTKTGLHYCLTSLCWKITLYFYTHLEKGSLWNGLPLSLSHFARSVSGGPEMSGGNFLSSAGKPPSSPNESGPLFICLIKYYITS